MYDSILENKWHVEVEFTEDEVHTHASARATLRDDATMTTTGDAYRNPRDDSQPMVGEEIAAARALFALATQLLEEASARIAQSPHPPEPLLRSAPPTRPTVGYPHTQSRTGVRLPHVRARQMVVRLSPGLPSSG